MHPPPDNLEHPTVRPELRGELDDHAVSGFRV